MYTAYSIDYFGTNYKKQNVKISAVVAAQWKMENGEGKVG